MSKTEDTSKQGPVFIRILRPIHGDISYGHIASAIERDGVYTWDMYGRFIKASDKGEINSKTHALELLSGLVGADEGYVEHIYDTFDHPINQYGWMDDKLPDFKGAHKEWIANHHGSGNMTEPVRFGIPLEKYPGRKRVIAALVIKAFSLGTLKECNKPKNMSFGMIKSKLETLGYTFDEKTLREVLKDLPEPEGPIQDQSN